MESGSIWQNRPPSVRASFEETLDTWPTPPLRQKYSNGMYTCPDGTDEGTRDLFEEIAILRSIVPKDSVSTTSTGERWQQRWRKAKEKTSSYISGVQSRVIAQHDALKTTLCNKWGICLDRWSRGMSRMIEKTPGCCLIEKLRSIILMEADYNANNKEIFGVNMIDNIRRHGLMMEEIFSEVGKTAEDGAGSLQPSHQ